MKTKGGEMKRRLACLVALVVSAVCADGVRYPLQDTSVSRGSKDSTYLHEKFLRIGNGFDACVMLPVEGLANVTSAKFKFYVPQCGEGAKYPLYFRVMRDDRWHHNMLTWNALPDEFRFAIRRCLLKTIRRLPVILRLATIKKAIHGTNLI
jgi:hypothetical protein